MKRLAVFAVICSLVLPLPAAARSITVAMRDSYGDGWNSAGLTIRVNGTALSSRATLSSTSSNSGTYTFNANTGDSVSFNWYAGEYDRECAFAVYYTNNTPSPAFNPASNATNNDVSRLLLYKLYTSLSSTANNAFLGSFKVEPEIAVSPKNVVLSAGGEQAFTSTIKYPNQAVTWSISGNDDDGTVISEDGVLTLSPDEMARWITVKATLVASTTFYDTARVYIPYLIGTAEELAAFADSINSGKNFNGCAIRLTADIDLSDYGEGADYNAGKGWIPIGTSTYPFRGNFDGDGHVISGLFIDNTTYFGFFGYIGSESAAGSVRNLGIEGADISGTGSIGGIVGSLRGYANNPSVIENCYVTGTINGSSSYIGGIVGTATGGWSNIVNCYSAAAINAASASQAVGGIAGGIGANSVISNCAALNPNVSGGTSYVGRVAGYNGGTASALSGNIAYIGMLNSAGTNVWSVSALNGEDIYGHEIYSGGTLGGRFAHEPWVTANGYLPGFVNPVIIPGHIINVPPVVTAVQIIQKDTVVTKGVNSNLQFSAAVSGTNKPSQAVVWSIYGASTGIAISAGGLLTVPAAADAATITVKAASAADPAKYAAITVTVLDDSDEAGLAPVARHGRLSVSGKNLVDEQGRAVQLRGMSFFWSMAGEGRDYYNADVVNWLADDWKVTVVRAAMGVDENWGSDASGYLAGDKSGTVSNKKRVTDVVDAAIAKGIYAIIDWHSHSANLNTAKAKEFFEEMAAKYKGVPNVIYEIYNEPDGYAWATVKTYSQTIVNAIRAIDENNVIIVGTPNWSQDVDIATASPVTGNNLAYSLHFYAYTHGLSLRNKASTALNNSKALFVSEFGTCNANGDTPIDTAATTTWLNFLNQNKTSWVNWSICNKAEAASALKSGTTKYNGNWLASDLTVSGTYIRKKLITADSIEKTTLKADLKTLKYKAGVNGRLSVNGSAVLVDSLSTKAAAGKSGPTVKALPNDGYLFAKWSDGAAAAERKDTNVTANLTVIAEFVPDTYLKLSYTAETGGSVTGSAIQWLAPGSDGETVEAVQGSGYVFAGWSDGVTAAKRTDINVTENVVVTAKFLKLYTLTYSAGTGGKISGTTAQTVAHGSSGESVSALPDDGYVFASWSDGVTADVRTDKNVTANVTATAQFAKLYTLTYSAGTGGKLSGKSSQTVAAGSNGESVTAVPDSGYFFVKWSDGVTTAERADKSIIGSFTVSAQFAKLVTLSYSAGTGGKISGNSSQAVVPGSNGETVSALPDSGYLFVRWSDNVTTAERTDKNITSDVSLSAFFAKTSFTLSYIVESEYGRIIGKSAQTVASGASGEEVYVLDNIAEGWIFMGWSDGSKSNPRRDKNVQDDITVTALFEQGAVSITVNERVVPQTPKTEEATVIAPAVILAGEFTVGPNPVRRGGNLPPAVNFYRIGRQVTSCELRIYDATGNIINKVKISDKALNTQAKRIVGSWDLRDNKGKIVSDGAYLVKGTLKTRNGDKEKISLILGVR